MTEQTVDTEQTEHSAGEVSTRPFADVLREMNKGRTHSEISDALQDLVIAVLDTGKNGTLTITLKVSSAKSHDMVVIEDDVKIKKPQARAASLFYVDDEGNVRREDPHQDPLPLVAAVAAPSKPIRKAE